MEVALLSKFDGGLDIRCHPLQHEEGLCVGSLIEVVQPDEVPDLGVAEALTELILKGLQGVKGILLKVKDGLLCFECLLIESDYVLGSHLCYELLVMMMVMCMLSM